MKHVVSLIRDILDSQVGLGSELETAIAHNVAAAERLKEIRKKQYKQGRRMRRLVRWIGEKDSRDAP